MKNNNNNNNNKDICNALNSPNPQMRVLLLTDCTACALYMKTLNWRSRTHLIFVIETKQLVLVTVSSLFLFCSQLIRYLPLCTQTRVYIFVIGIAVFQPKF